MNFFQNLWFSSLVLKKMQDGENTGTFTSKGQTLSCIFSRFFKIFPLLGQHQVGLEKYARYLCSQVGVMILFASNKKIKTA